MILDQDQVGSRERGLNPSFADCDQALIEDCPPGAAGQKSLVPTSLPEGQPAALVAEATELVAPQQSSGPDFMQSIYDTWGYVSNHKSEAAGVAITAVVATAAAAYFKPWTLLPGVGGAVENIGTRLMGANAAETLISAGIPITAESRAAARTAAALGFSPIERAVAINGTRFGVIPSAESLILNGTPITAENRRLAARGLLRLLTDR